MCKRFVTTIVTCLAGMLSLFSALTFSACEKQGEEVNEQQWGESIEQTLIATNYTVNFTDETPGNEKSNVSGKALITENGFYCELKGTESDNSTVNIQAYLLIEENQIWTVWKNSSANEWVASSSSREYYDEYLKENGGLTFLEAKYSLEKGGEQKSLKELFPEFTYANGKYSATLYGEYNSGYETYVTQGNLSLKVSNGYIIEVDRDASYEVSYSEITLVIDVKGNYKYSNFGTTKLTVPQEVLDAIEAEKAKQ